MIHEEEEYSLGKIPADEPVFLIRGKDPTAFETVLRWEILNKANLPKEKRHSVLRHAQRMRAYYEQKYFKD